MKVLVVDDAKISRMMLLKRLPEKIKSSATLLEGEDGEDAVKLYKEHLPDIVFLDLTMPIKSGYESLKEIMALDGNAVVYIITADIQKKAKEKVLMAGATGIEIKPITQERLTEVFSTLEEG